MSEPQFILRNALVRYNALSGYAIHVDGNALATPTGILSLLGWKLENVKILDNRVVPDGSLPPGIMAISPENVAMNWSPPTSFFVPKPPGQSTPKITDADKVKLLTEALRKVSESAFHWQAVGIANDALAETVGK